MSVRREVLLTSRKQLRVDVQDITVFDPELSRLLQDNPSEYLPLVRRCSLAGCNFACGALWPRTLFSGPVRDKVACMQPLAPDTIPDCTAGTGGGAAAAAAATPRGGR